MAQVLDNKYLISILLSYLGTVHLLAEGFDDAVEQADAALAMRRELGLELYTADDLATLAAAHLGLADAAKAVDYAQQSLHILDECGGEGPEFPHRDYFICYQVLAAAGQTDTAHAALRSARELVMARADKITDPTWRQSFLTKVPANRAIVQEWEAIA